MKIKYAFNKIHKFLFVLTLCFMSINSVSAEVPDPQQGLRADWMRGAWGLLWLPEKNYNGNIEGVRMDDFIEQIKDLKTLDYVQVGLVSPNIYSPVHTAPHPIIESLWMGDVDDNGKPINLVVPRATEDDPFGAWLEALNEAGLKVEVYVNSYNLLARIPDATQAAYPDISDRWMNWCDTSAIAQEFIDSKDYHDGSGRRKYMFCYAEYILKEYSIRYGDLIHAWCFDSADNIMEDECGDDPASEDLDDQRIYQAFADACHVGNPNAAISFNNSVGERLENPFSTATYFDDYTFGHPFGGAGDMVENEILYAYNYHVVKWMSDYNGYAFRDDTRDWNDNVVGHFFPKQSTTSWNAGSTPCLTDEQFVEWNSVGLIDGGAITWGSPLVRTNLENSPVLTLQPYALVQETLTDEHLQAYQNAGKPNWYRQQTVLPKAYIDQAYYYELVEGEDFWDTDKDAMISLVQGEDFPAWLNISESSATPGNYIISGTPTETVATDYTFNLRAKDATNVTDREIKFQVLESQVIIPNPGDGKPVWLSDDAVELSTKTLEPFSEVLLLGRDFYDFEGDDLTISIKENPQWITSNEVTSGVWELTGTPTELEEGINNLTLTLSDGTSSVERDLTVVVHQRIIEKTAYYNNAQIIAAADSTYGVDNVATIVSDMITAPDGLATFQISVDLIPPTGKSIASASTGGVATANAWGLGADGRDATKDALFFGDSADWANVANVQVINFDANGSSFNLSDFTDLILDSVKVVNAPSGGKDAVAYAINGETTDLGSLATSPFIFDLPNVKYFAIGTGTTANMDKNKWSVEALSVAYSLGEYYMLNLTSEHGSVTSSLDLPAYKVGTEVRLIAIPDSSYYFTGWEGNIAGATINGDTIMFMMDANKNITATYDEIYRKLEVSAENGTIVISPDQEYFNIGDKVQLIAVPDLGYAFDAWGGDLLGAIKNEDTLTVYMYAHKSITATFTLTSSIPTSLKEIGYSISPNPSDGVYSVNLEQIGNADYTVYDLNGVEILRGTTPTSFELDMTLFTQGIYLFRMSSEHGVSVKKLILK